LVPAAFAVVSTHQSALGPRGMSICPDEGDDDDKFYLFNTNVVFDRTGAVIDRQAAVFLVFIFPLLTNITSDLYCAGADFAKVD
jgi:hypothetical protein